jgi:hypothetical protein
MKVDRKLYPAGTVRYRWVVFCGHPLCNEMQILTGDERYQARELHNKGWTYQRSPRKWGWSCPECSRKDGGMA